MGVRALYDPTENRAAMYDSVSELAFGPVFHFGDNGMHPVEAVDKFTSHCEAQGYDPRNLHPSMLGRLFQEWGEESGYDGA